MKFRIPLAFRAARGAALVLAVAGAASAGAIAPALGQAVVTAVNGDPITSFDVAEYEKILRLERKPASSADALEAVVGDRLRYDEARHWGIDATDSDLSAALQRVAASLKMDTQTFTQASAKAKIDLDTIRSHLRASAAWDNLVRARNKGVGATEEEISSRDRQGRHRQGDELPAAADRLRGAGEPVAGRSSRPGSTPPRRCATASTAATTACSWRASCPTSP